MGIKYVGPKPIISHTGIEFDNNKEDKFVYLNIAVQLIKAIDHEYIEDRKYTYDTNSARLSNDELMDELKQYCPKLNSIVERRNAIIEEDIEHDIQRARENTFLNEENKKILENNIELMHDYLVQRSINKDVYYCVVDNLAQMLKKDNIDYIVAPMFQNFLHVFHSVQGSMKRQRIPVDTGIEIFKREGQLLAKFQVKNRKQ